MITYGGLLTFLEVVFLLFLIAILLLCGRFLFMLIVIFAGPPVLLTLLFGGEWGTVFKVAIGGVFAVFIWLYIADEGLPFR